MKERVHLRRKDLLGIRELSREEIELVLETASSFKEVIHRPVKKVPTLRGQAVVNLFYEPSTRTRTSFELAAKRLSADLINISVQSSSIQKGESLYDTAKTLEAMQVGMIVLRHPQVGAAHALAARTTCSVINAGDGAGEHPTQALVDLFTIKEKKERVEGLNVLIVGDILHSRVARSDIFALSKMGARVRVCGPPTLIPVQIKRMGVEQIFYRLEEALDGVDVVIMLRIQRERQKEQFFPSLQEYINLYSLSTEKLVNAKNDILIMHPGPINRGVELSGDIADGPFSLIQEQVQNGIAVRMAVLYLLAQSR